jgi:hypothetical protein
MFREYTVRVAIPQSHATKRGRVEKVICGAYPGMRVQFEDAEQLRLVGVEAPDRQSARAVLPLLEKIIRQWASSKNSNSFEPSFLDVKKAHRPLGTGSE